MFKSRRKGKRPKLLLGVFLIYAIALSIIPINPAEADLAGHVVVNEVQTNSGSGGAEYDDWVELYNPTAGDIDLSTWSIQKTSGTGTSFYRKALSGIIPAEGYFLIVRNHASTTPSLIALANVLAAGSSFSLTDNNIIYLVNDNIDIENNNDANIVDYVGMGSASYYEGAAAPNPGAGQSIARVPDGEDSGNNYLDFKITNKPTPKSGSASGNDIGGTVFLTITPEAQPVQNITPTTAQIVFQVNDNGTALINYGLTSSYGSSTVAEAVSANITKTMNLSGLACDKIYHYSIYAENNDAGEHDATVDATFTTLPCGIKLDSLTMTKATAKANDQYADGWQWEFNITVWDTNETSLKIKFDQWSGAGTLAAAGNMQFSADGGITWLNITVNGAYPASGIDVSSLDNSAVAGRQIKIIVRMKVPVGTAAGYYNSSYGILTE